MRFVKLMNHRLWWSPFWYICSSAILHFLFSFILALVHLPSTLFLILPSFYSSNSPLSSWCSHGIVIVRSGTRATLC